MKFRVKIFLILSLCLLFYSICNIQEVPSNIDYSISNFHTFSTKNDAINNITLAQNEIFNATDHLIYLNSINGYISDLVIILDLAISLLNNASEMLNQSQYNISVYLATMARNNATLVITEANLRIPGVILNNQQTLISSIIMAIVIPIIIAISTILIYKLIKFYNRRKFLKMKISLPEEESK
ncbi:MAG: hypothetical protein ACTSPY_03320 [Candidatus Helarchaeota archaeon]